MEFIIKELKSNAFFQVGNVFNHAELPNWHIDPRTMDNWLLAFFRKGSGWFTIDGEQFSVSPGKLVFIQDNLVHSAGQDPSDPLCMTLIRFGYRCTGTKDYKPYKFPSFGFGWSALKPSYFDDLFARIHRVHVYGANTLMSSIQSTLLTLIFQSLYLEILSTSDLDTSDRRIDDAKLFIQENVTTPLSLGQVAYHVGLSPQYFSRLFKQSQGQTFKEYVYRTKMQHARSLFRETSYSVKEVSQLLGYADQYVFSNQFKKTYGLPPSAVRNHTKHHCS